MPKVTCPTDAIPTAYKPFRTCGVTKAAFDGARPKAAREIAAAAVDIPKSL